MKIDKFKRFILKSENLPTDWDFDKYKKETGRDLPEEIRSGSFDSLLFVSWLRGEIRAYRESSK